MEGSDMDRIRADQGGPALETRELTVRYGQFVAVDRASIQVRSGEVFGLLGPNGAGKTSMIRALTTILPISSGVATVVGHDVTDRMAVRSAIGVLPESNGYPGAQRARGYLRFYGRLFGLGRREADDRAERLLEQLGLAGNDRRIATFSRGMRQRLGLCRALINEPRLLFLDEPTLGLDPAGREEILTHLADLAVNQGTTVLLCTHMLDEVERVCDRVAIMNGGHIVASGTVDDVIDGSGIGSTASIRVPVESVTAAFEELVSATSTHKVSADTTRPGTITIELGPVSTGRIDLVRRLIDAGIEIRSFDLYGARLSDAFLAITRPRSGSTEPGFHCDESSDPEPSVR